MPNAHTSTIFLVVITLPKSTNPNQFAKRRMCSNKFGNKKELFVNKYDFYYRAFQGSVKVRIG